MAKKAICSITTKSHWYKSFALAESIHQIDANICFCLLTVDATEEDLKSIRYTKGKVNMYLLNDILFDETAKKIAQKYQAKSDYLRWSLKSILLIHLLQNENYEKVFYCDNDIYFCNDFGFLMEDLTHHAVLLTPHYYCFNPEKKQILLEANFRSGLYNAGFVGVNKDAISVLSWWAKCCLYRCERKYTHGLFVDQKYLDLFPIMEPKTKIVRHKGCNVAYWNIMQNERQVIDNQVVIEKKYPVIFIHFAADTFQGIVNKEDALLHNYLEKYCDILRKYKPDFLVTDEFKKVNYKGIYTYLKWLMENFLYRLSYRKWYK